MFIRNITLAFTLACGAIGVEERSQMLASKEDYNVHMTFATRGSGVYRSDVQVEIADSKGRVNVSAQDAGPLMYVNLEPGRYRVTASAADGQVLRREVQVLPGHTKELYFYWSEPATIVQ